MMVLTAAVTIVLQSSSPKALGALEMERNPDVRCVVIDCFRPPRTKEGIREQRRFERRLLSPKGNGRLE